jgi:hypothetical protein
MYVRVGEDSNKGINNLNGVFSGVTRYNWSNTPNIVQYYVLTGTI